MLENGNNTVMPVQPMYGGNGSFGGYGDSSLFWIIILFLFAFNGGWGNGFGNGTGGNTGYITNDIQRGFDQSATINNLNGINTAVANGFANAEVSRCNNAFNLSNQLNTMAMNNQQCCCNTQSQIQDLKAVTLQENCADRAAVSDGVRDILASQAAGTQRILDQMCADKIDAKNEEISRLRQELDMVSLANSQNQQTGEIINALRMPTPVPAFAVNPPYQFGGCGCNNGFGYNG